MATKPKARARLSDPTLAAPKDRESVNVEKIKNGYLITRSGVKNGEYFDHKEYSPTDPLKAARSVRKEAPRGR
jgi:hypothetical protein